MNSSSVLMLVVAVLSLVGGSFFIWGGFKERSMMSRLDETGVSTEAQVVERRISGTARNRTLYVKYSFEAVKPDGSRLTYTSDQSVNRDNYEALPEGSKATIRYLPDNPEGTARLSGGFADNTFSNSGFAYGSGCLIAAILILGVMFTSISQATTRASATAAKVSTASVDFPAVRAVLDPLLPTWEATKDQANHQVSPASIGLASSSITQIDYGYCNDDFYVYAVKQLQPGLPGVRGGEAYSYTSKSEFCWPEGWIVYSKGDLGSGWRLSQLAIMVPKPRDLSK